MALIDAVDLSEPQHTMEHPPIRILASCNILHGGNDYSFVRAFRRAGHSVQVVPPESFLPRWETKWLKALRRLAYPAVLAEYNRALTAAAKTFEPDLFFVFKGASVAAETVETARVGGAVTINFYPDTGFDGCAADAIANYDWVFTTKPSHIEFLKQRYGYTNAEFLTHAFDPEVHAAPQMGERDRQRYGCDVVFIGNTSRKKEKTLDHIVRALPDTNFKFWGAGDWGKASSHVREVYMGSPVWGLEYAKAINGAKINLGLLYEGSPGAPAGDVITARTFEVPAAGGFMLHERTDEAMQYFEEGRQCGFFDDPEDLVEKIRYYLANEGERCAMAVAGRQRALTSGYSYDDRVETVVAKYWELQAVRLARQH